MKLEGKTRQGDFVHANQTMNTDFKNVSQKWVDKCIPFSKGFEQLELERAETEDIMASVQEMVPAVSGDRFVFKYQDREFIPTEFGLEQSASRVGLSTYFARDLNTPKLGVGKKSETVVYERDRQDAETLVVAYNNYFRRLDQDKQYLWRTRKDGSLRAMLTDKYSIVDNRWFLEVLQEAVPDGLLSHWRGDSDTLWGNILIPDSIREEDDSDYGGMISVGNSEIGIRKISSLPSVFRAICMNGCIWDQEKGQGIQHVHKGKLNLSVLREHILDNIQSQIPLTTLAIDKLLETREVKVDVAGNALLAQFAIDNKFSKKMATSLLDSYLEEIGLVPSAKKTLFGLVGAITRAGQTMSNQQWVKLDALAGEYVAKPNLFIKLANRAEHLSESDIVDCFSAA